ncbi:hypothetical protein H4N54_21380 [Limnospira fusiformis KN01]|uniref:Uncharacterized protein n=2 Tax=Limnospira TaxID=2596745 RepID=A0A9P1KB02_9CYAN|nr:MULTISPECIES: hypothetical protein [Limnospira]EDZ95552.1 hypothetical protein AmaxDRAFT_1822 [Limnospira maxima CS-328]EKD10159.1 hypothetical protein SPLC1_S101890 [Arthrospira platensis C1]MDC0839108.1 hypothetical protein [Limnoraphis robusta]MDT9186482.1 hypothetical protein [Limnospira sp. PMC 894.15]MDT9247727.1 hypothetical protein [Limnospira sp. PMC 1280.21]MDT9283401.1 hypothetical protein [Limnospira sp. PMC 1298.21]MDT9314163.1 hypothetical protein [Limnospira sp. PMC 1306.21
MPNIGLTLEQSEAIVDYLAGGNQHFTEAKKAALLAFFEQQNAVVNEPAATEIFCTSLTPSWQLVLMALGGCLILLILSNLTWRDRFTGVRNKLVEKSMQH